jgi:hypothetical protein
MVDVPTALTTLSTAVSEIAHLTVANTTGSAVTFLLTDYAGNALIPTVSIPANSVMDFGREDPDFTWLVGLKWQAGGAGLKAEYSIWTGTQVAPGINWTISVSDTVTVTDVATQNFVLKVSVSDSVTTGEAVARAIGFPFGASESVTVSDSATLQIQQLHAWTIEHVVVSEKIDFVVS